MFQRVLNIMLVYEESLVKILERINNLRLDYNTKIKHKQFICQGVQVRILEDKIMFWIRMFGT